MKTRIGLLAVVIFNLAFTATFAQTGIKRLLTGAVSPGQSTLVSFELPGIVNVNYWDQNYISVHFEVKTNLNNTKVFELLIEEGRYNIIKRKNSGYFFELALPNIREEVSVNGNELEESFSFKIYVPRNIEIDVKEKSDLTVNENLYNEAGNLLAANQINQ